MNLTEIRKLIPTECFQKNLKVSLFYLLRDVSILSSAFFVFEYVKGNYFLLFFYWMFYGFFMWCLFVVGHDCGHGSFSTSQFVNDVCGHIAHTPLLVPFWPWAHSHRQHHLYHQHEKKDKSHPWHRLKKENMLSYKFLKTPIISPLVMLVSGFFTYMYLGLYDGVHIFPGALFKTTKDKYKCVVSTLTVFIFLASMIYYSGRDFIFFYGIPWIVFASWLFLVTYLQHHKEVTFAYDDSNWNYLDGALETIDRKYGYGIDDLHHNISDCHVVHHLFFTQIPHYHLKQATESIKNYLIEKGKYNYVEGSFFFFDFLKVFHLINQYDWTPVRKIEQSEELVDSSKV